MIKLMLTKTLDDVLTRTRTVSMKERTMSEAKLTCNIDFVIVDIYPKSTESDCCRLPSLLSLKKFCQKKIKIK